MEARTRVSGTPSQRGDLLLFDPYHLQKSGGSRGGSRNRYLGGQKEGSSLGVWELSERDSGSKSTVGYDMAWVWIMMEGWGEWSGKFRKGKDLAVFPGGV